MAGISAAGFVISLVMKHLPLHTSVDRDWGRRQEGGAGGRGGGGGDGEEDAEMRALNVNVRKEERRVSKEVVV